MSGRDWLLHQTKSRHSARHSQQFPGERLENLGLAAQGTFGLLWYHGIWAGGEVQAAKGTAEKEAFLIGQTALLNRARYVPCDRTALDWPDTADLPSTTAGLQVSRLVPSKSGIYLPRSSAKLFLGGSQGILGLRGYLTDPSQGTSEGLNSEGQGRGRAGRVRIGQGRSSQPPGPPRPLLLFLGVSVSVSVSDSAPPGCLFSPAAVPGVDDCIMVCCSPQFRSMSTPNARAAKTLF